MNKKVKISAAGNVRISACLAMKDKAYHVYWEKAGDKEYWFAKKDNLMFTADSPLELLGLITVYEERGDDWDASDMEIDDFMRRYKKNSSNLGISFLNTRNKIGS